jgi:hypothetical protein
MPLPDEVDNIVITPVLAVWADRSFAGGEKEAEFVFMRRRASRDAWATVVEELEAAVKGVGMSPAAFKQALARVDSANTTTQSAVLQNMRSTLSKSLDDVEQGRASAASRLAAILQHARDNLAAAAAHSR